MIATIKVDGVDFQFDLKDRESLDNFLELVKSELPPDCEKEYEAETLYQTCQKLGIDYELTLKRLSTCVSKSHLKSII